MKTLLILLFVTATSFSQWPGYFYTFILKDSDGKVIDSSNKNYQMETIKGVESDDLLLSIKMCDDNSAWRFYEGGYHGLDKTHMLKITNSGTGEVMTIKFPPSMSGGKEKYYRDLYAGKIKFKKGTYKIKLPESDDEWDDLKEIKICPLSYMTNHYYDISGFQNQR
jgi:hypothetical protein